MFYWCIVSYLPLPWQMKFYYEQIKIDKLVSRGMEYGIFD